MLHQAVGFLLSTTIILALAPHPVFAQDCSDCGSRNIQVYDFAIGFAAPTTYDTLTVNAYFIAMKYAPVVGDYLTLSGSSCFTASGCEATRVLTMATVQANLPILGWMHGTLPHQPGGSEGSEYNIQGTATRLQSGGEDAVQVSFSLRAQNGETVVSATEMLSSNLTPSDIPVFVNITMQSQFGSVGQKLRDYEISKRESGEPYAIDPGLECTVDKRFLDFNEKTKLHFELKDCDDEPLKQRQVTVDDCSIGQLDQMSFTTDDNGQAVLEYTAPPATAGIADITLSFTYTEPWASTDKQQDKEGHVYLNIKAPTDSWAVSAFHSFTETTNSTTSILYGPASSSKTHSAEMVQGTAWLKKMVLPPQVPPGYFVSEPTLLAVSFNGHNSSRGDDRSFYSDASGYIKDVGDFYRYADLNAGASPKIAVSINDSNYSFRFTDLDATQDGSSHTFEETYNIIEGTKTSSGTTPASPTTAMNWGQVGFVWDTTYTFQEQDGNTFHLTRYNQKCTWNDTTFVLKLLKEIIDDTDYDDGIVKEKTHSIQRHSIVIEMVYNDAPSAAEDPESALPISFELEQNYPNPFNPITQMGVRIAEFGMVKLSVCDMLGREVMVLANEERSPGSYTFTWDATNMPSGVYFYTLTAGGFRETKRMVLLK